MKIIRSYVKALLVIEISHDEIDLITDCSKHHYDLKCRSISQPGGFVYAWNNMDAGGVIEWNIDQRQCDLLSKVLEVAPPGEEDRARELREKLHDFMARITEIEMQSWEAV